MASSQSEFVKLFKTFEGVEGYLASILEKVANIEIRQSRASGETNDAIRAVQQWAQADSSCLPRNALRRVVEIMESDELPTYYQAFLSKDHRRGEYEMYKLYELCIKKNEYVANDSQHATGECFVMLPSLRKKLEKEMGKPLKTSIPDVLQELYKLTKPLDRRYKPWSLIKMKEGKLLPKHYEGYQELTDEEARVLWREVSSDHKELQVVDDIPLHELDSKGLTWHEKLMLKIHMCNEHTRSVAEADETILQDDENEEPVTEEQIKQANENHAKKLDKFWSSKDPAGAFKIERAAGIKKKWIEEAEKAAEKVSEIGTVGK